MDYKTGDVVVQRGETVPMTVESVTGDWVTCIWFPKDAEGNYVGGLDTGTFLPSDLEKIKRQWTTPS